MALQSKSLAKVYKNGEINDFQWSQINQELLNLTDDQGKAERTKKFPYPRNFSSIATYLLLIFVVLTPFSLVQLFEDLGKGTFMEGKTIWLNIPFAAILTWVFHTLDADGQAAVNPFEGGANDVPITQISLMIEIDMREMLDEETLLPPILPQNNILI